MYQNLFMVKGKLGVPEGNQLKRECFEKKFYSFGTAKIFEKRVEKYGLWLKVITFMGLLSPVVLGCFVAAFSTDSETLKVLLLPICGLMTIAQAILSLFSLVFKWDDVYAYSLSAVKINTRLTSDFDQLSCESDEEIRKNISRLRDEYNRQEVEDTAKSISAKEKCFAMRNALFQYKSRCRSCNQIPLSLTPTVCDT